MLLDAGVGQVFSSFGPAFAAVADGGVVFVHSGRHQGPVALSGARGPLLIEGVGASALIDCSIPASTGWFASGGNRFSMTPTGVVSAVFLDGGFLPRARYPARGYAQLSATQGTGGALRPAASDLTALAGRSLSNAFLTALVTEYWWQTASGLALDGGTLLLGTSAVNAAECDQPSCAFSFAPQPEWSYYLENEEWMLSQPGAWVYDFPQNRLTVWAPDSQSPAGQGFSFGTPTSCVRITNSANVTVRNLEVAASGGTGLELVDSVNARLSAVRIHDVRKTGIELMRSDPVVIDDSVIARSGQACVIHVARPAPASMLTSTYESNVFEDCGTPVGPRFTVAAVYTQPDRFTSMVARNNLIRRSAYHGFYAAGGMRLEGNTIEDVCLFTEDCGGIYVHGVGGQVVRRNIINGLSPVLVGRPGPPVAIGGLYVDESAQNALFEENLVVGARTGVLINNAYDNTFQRNVLLASSRAAVFMSETHPRRSFDVGSGTFVGVNDGGFATSNNRFVSNVLVSGRAEGLVSQSVSVRLASGERQGLPALRDAYRANGNQYWSLFSKTPVVIENPFIALEWGDVGDAGLDPGAGRPDPFFSDGYRFTGAPTRVLSFVSSNFPAAWNRFPASLVHAPVTCPAPSTSGVCGVVSGPEDGVLISPLFPTLRGLLYRIRVQLRSGADAGVTYPKLRSNVTFESLNTLAEPIVSLRADRWTDDTSFAQVDASVAVSRLDLEAQVGQFGPLIVGDIVIDEGAGRRSETADHLFVSVNPDYTRTRMSGCGDAGLCAGWRSADGGNVTLPVSVPPRSAVYFWRP